MTDGVPFLSLGEAISDIRPDLDDAYARVMAGGQFIRGPEVSAFEEEFAAVSGTAHAVGTGNGFDALVLALGALGIGPGDEVITPCHTFIATWLAISATGAKPVPVDVDPVTWTITAEAVEAALGSATRAVIPVHIYGHPVDMDPILDLCRANDIRVVEDAAQAHGAKYKGRTIGGLGDAAAFSFYPTKNLGAFGDGGAVTTDMGELAERVGMLGNYGAAEKDWSLVSGVNSRLDELQAAFLRVKLAHLDRWNTDRRRIAARYLSELSNLPLGLPPAEDWAAPVWCVFAVRSKRRDDLAAFLHARGIGTQVHYPFPPHLQDAYRDLPVDRARLAESESVAREVLSLPIWPHMTDDMVNRVIEGIKAFFAGA